MSDTGYTSTHRDMAVRHRIPIAEVEALERAAGNDTILDAACAARARGAPVAELIAAMRDTGLDGRQRIERLNGLRELNG